MNEPTATELQTPAPAENPVVELPAAAEANHPLGQNIAVTAAGDNETIVAQAEAGINNPLIARETLVGFAKGGGGQAIAEHGRNHRQLVKDNKNLSDEQRNQEATIGYDLEISGLQLEIVEQQEMLAKAKGKNRENINQKIQALQQQLESVSAERDLIKLPNQLAEFATAFGVSDELAQQAPLVAVRVMLSQAAENPTARKDLITRLKQHPQFQDDDMQAAIDALGDSLARMQNKGKVEKGAKTVGKIAMGISLFGILMAWIASKQKGEGAQH